MHDGNNTVISSAAWVSAQRYRALTMILQSLKTQTMISEMPSLCHIACASKTYQILSPLLFQQSLYFFLLIHRFFIYLSLSFFCMLCSMCLTIIPSTTAELCSAKKMAIYSHKGYEWARAATCYALARKSSCRHAMKMATVQCIKKTASDRCVARRLLPDPSRVHRKGSGDKTSHNV